MGTVIEHCRDIRGGSVTKSQLHCSAGSQPQNTKIQTIILLKHARHLFNSIVVHYASQQRTANPQHHTSGLHIGFHHRPGRYCHFLLLQMYTLKRERLSR